MGSTTIPMEELQIVYRKCTTVSYTPCTASSIDKVLLFLQKRYYVNRKYDIPTGMITIPIDKYYLSVEDATFPMGELLSQQESSTVSIGNTVISIANCYFHTEKMTCSIERLCWFYRKGTIISVGYELIPAGKVLRI